MTQFYIEPKREDDAYALPDAEVFWIPTGGDEGDWEDEDGDPMPSGWYWWSCFPGCLPDGDPMGPFATEAEAIEDARQYNEPG